MMWSTVEGRCPWCGNDRETIYTVFNQRICGPCAMKLSRAFIKDVIEPEKRRLERELQSPMSTEEVK